MGKDNNFYKVKDCKVQSIKDISTSSRVVTGFYNTYNYIDSDSDVLVLGAAKKSITERGPNSVATAKIKHALFHDLMLLPGKILTLEEKTIDGITGIYFETKMSDTTIGNDTLQNYLDGIYDNHSIGFRYIDIRELHKGTKEFDEFAETIVNKEDISDVIYKVNEIKLYEGSTVAFGANKFTPFLGVKSQNAKSYIFNILSKIDKINTVLKTGTQSDDMMLQLELSMLQMKQMIADLEQFIKIEDIKQAKNSELDWDYIINNIKFTNTLKA